MNIICYPVSTHSFVQTHCGIYMKFHACGHLKNIFNIQHSFIWFPNISKLFINTILFHSWIIIIFLEWNLFPELKQRWLLRWLLSGKGKLIENLEFSIVLGRMIFVIKHNEHMLCLICQEKIAFFKEYNQGQPFDNRSNSEERETIIWWRICEILLGHIVLRPSFWREIYHSSSKEVEYREPQTDICNDSITSYRVVICSELQ